MGPPAPPAPTARPSSAVTDHLPEPNPPANPDPKTHRAWIAHCYGTIGAGRGMTVDSGSGAELYAVIGQAPRGLDLMVNQDNTRAIRFYEKHGFAVTGADVNSHSGAPLHKMSWRP